jgi:hypothetical protein
MAAQRKMYPPSVDNGIRSPYVGRMQVYQAYLGAYRNLDRATSLEPDKVDPHQHALPMVEDDYYHPGHPKEGVENMVLLVMWEVWKECNARVFDASWGELSLSARRPPIDRSFPLQPHNCFSIISSIYFPSLFHSFL